MTHNDPKIPNAVQMPEAVATEQAVSKQIPASQLLDTEVRGQDLRTLAEARADEAGQKWREKALANGEIEKEIGGPQGLEPTRYGDWEKAGRCFDF